MKAMLRRYVFCLTVFVAGFGLVVSSLAAGAQQDSSKRGRKYKSPPPTARIEVTVLRDTNGKPIENAAVIFHPMQGERDKGALELKTNEDGKAIIDVLPIGDTVRLQIIARGFQTYGEDFKVDKSEITFEIKMKRPGEQYSIYKNHGEAAQGGKSPDAGKAPTPATNPVPRPANPQPAGSSSQPNTQPSTTQSQPK
jgi:5-hydroxyisourate hydrolase-like protein (transthyretin family)